uniref:Uncharacterized protein n=1 Tax=Globodera rostochiensis TaxID=31243 RepID=A0A914H7I7_GLORO
MGTCASNKKLMVVRQSSTMKKLGTTAIHATDLKNHVAMMHTQQMNSNNNVKQYNPIQHERDNSVKLLKHDSGLNLLPAELQLNMTALSDETVFEREKRMVVLLVSSQHDKPSQLAVLDVDFQSPGFGKVIRRLDLPLAGEELYSLGCMRNTHSNLHDLEHMTEQYSQFTLVAPVPSHSRIYVFTLMEGSSSGSLNGSLGKQAANADVNGASNRRLIKMRIQKCITREELSRWDLGDAVPLLVVTTVDRYGHCKGDLIRLDRRTYCPVDRRRRSDTEENKSNATNSPSTSESSSPTLLSRSTLTTGISATISATTRFPHFGGALAIHLRHLLAFTTEWGDLDQILCHCPNLKAPKFGSQEVFNLPPEDPIYGNKVNVWDMRRRTLFQKIKLEPPEDGRWPICIRMVHQAELTHGFVCTALGSSIYHLHKSTKTDLFSADRVIKFSPVTVGDWPGEVPEVPAFLTDMVISMDDQYLYVCAAFHGFVAQLNISDPFRPSLTQKVFLGGIVCQTMGVLHGGKTPIGKNSAMRSYNTERRFFVGRSFEGGPSRLQLSLDGRRLFVSNSFLRNWDEHFFPQLAERGGAIIVLIHIDPVDVNPMKLDPNIGIHFETDEQKQQQHHRQAEKRLDKNGTAAAATQPQQQPPHFYAREMRFLNGDSTADHL